MASTCRPVTRVDVRAAAVATISVTVTAGLCRKRVSLISPARSLPSRQTRTPLPPNSTNRACNNAPLFPVAGRQPAPASTQPWSPPPTESAGKGSQAALLKARLLEMCECRRVKPGGDASAYVRQRQDFIALEVSEEIIRRCERILVRGREGFLVGLDQPFILVDPIKALADLGAFGRAGLGDRARGQMHRIVSVGDADRRGDVGQRLDLGIFFLQRVQHRGRLGAGVAG